MKFGMKLKKMMALHKMTQVDLSEQLGLSKAQIHRYTLSNKPPKAEIASKLAQIFKVPMDYFIYEEFEFDTTGALLKEGEMIKELQEKVHNMQDMLKTLTDAVENLEKEVGYIRIIVQGNKIVKEKKKV